MFRSVVHLATSLSLDKGKSRSSTTTPAFTKLSHWSNDSASPSKYPCASRTSPTLSFRHCDRVMISSAFDLRESALAVGIPSSQFSSILTSFSAALAFFQFLPSRVSNPSSFKDLPDLKLSKSLVHVSLHAIKSTSTVAVIPYVSTSFLE